MRLSVKATDMPEGISGPVGFFDPAGFSDDLTGDPQGAEGHVQYLREAELKHGRICMLAWTGWVTVDLGVRIVAMPQEWEGLTSATAHDKLCEYGAMGNMAIWLALAEIVSWLGVAQMLQGSGREPGDFGIGKQFLEGKTKEQVDRVKLQELKNGRLAMFAFSGVVTQSILSGNGFPYTM